MGRLFDGLAPARKSTYLAAAGGDRDQAEAIYQWNSDLSGAFSEVLGHLECHLRQAMDAALRKWNQTQDSKFFGEQASPGPEWALPGQAARPLQRIVRSSVEKAVERASRQLSRRDVGHDDVVAQMTFGTWVAMLPKGGQNTAYTRLWDEAFRDVFQRTHSVGPKVLVARLNRLRDLRNRIAHHENLLKVNVEARISDVLSVLALLDQELADEVAGVSRVRAVNVMDPRKSARPTDRGTNKSIRHLRSEDSFLIRELFRLSQIGVNSAMTHKDISRDPNARKYVHVQKGRGDFGRVALVDGAEVGAVWCQFFQESDSQLGSSSSRVPEMTIGVVDGYRNLGIGTLLIKEIMQELAHRGIPEVSLCLPSNSPAASLFRRFGFRPVSLETGENTWLRKAAENLESREKHLMMQTRPPPVVPPPN